MFGASQGYRYHVLEYLPLWSLIAILNLVYAVASTSWLLHGLFVITCYSVILLACFVQFSFFAYMVRQLLRSTLKHLHIVNDKIASFDISALETNTDVTGLMVIRGFSITLSTMTILAHGVELGIKLSDDLELAIQTERVTLYLFRKI
jgi:hypothetical protein